MWYAETKLPSMAYLHSSMPVSDSQTLSATGPINNYCAWYRTIVGRSSIPPNVMSFFQYRWNYTNTCCIHNKKLPTHYKLSGPGHSQPKSYHLCVFVLNLFQLCTVSAVELLLPFLSYMLNASAHYSQIWFTTCDVTHKLWVTVPFEMRWMLTDDVIIYLTRWIDTVACSWFRD